MRVVPPLLVRRLVLAPAVLVVSVVAWTALPLTAVAAAAVSPWLPGRWRPLRVLWFALVFLVVESVALLGLFGLWLASGAGSRLDAPAVRRAHHRLMALYLDVVVRVATRVFNLRLDVVDRAPASTRSPVVVLARHAGPGDSFLLVHALTSAGRRPRVVLKATLQWAPALDVLLNRIPSAFVGSGAARQEAVQHIGTLAADLAADDALVIFPEGGNFTEERRVRSIAKLEELGQHDRAERARTMRYVLSPRSAGVVAALDAAPPDAEVLFVAHTGLEDLSGVVDLWRGMPLDAAVRVQVWRVPAGEIPADDAGRISWLDGWWHRIDRWILEHRGEDAVPDPVLDQLPDAPPDTDTAVEGEA